MVPVRLRGESPRTAWLLGTTGALAGRGLTTSRSQSRRDGSHAPRLERSEGRDGRAAGRGGVALRRGAVCPGVHGWIVGRSFRVKRGADLPPAPPVGGLALEEGVRAGAGLAGGWLVAELSDLVGRGLPPLL